jgi:antitoxin FitA
MTKMLQVRDVPDEVHARLEKCAEAAGMSMSAYVLSALKDHLERRSLDEIGRRAEARGTLRFRSPMRHN